VLQCTAANGISSDYNSAVKYRQGGIKSTLLMQLLTSVPALLPVCLRSWGHYGQCEGVDRGSWVLPREQQSRPSQQHKGSVVVQDTLAGRAVVGVVEGCCRLMQASRHESLKGARRR
jgi:hypothetical protein